MRWLFRLRAILFVVVASCAAFFYGVDNVTHDAADSRLAGRYPKCIILNYHQFVQRHPTEGWFRITGGELDLVSARAVVTTIAHDHKNETVTSLEIPLRDVNAPDEAPSPVVLFTSDPELCSTWQEINGLVDSDAAENDISDTKTDGKPLDDKTEKRVAAYVKAHPDKIWVDRDIEGIIKSPDAIETGVDESSTAKTMPDNVTKNYVVLEDGKTGADYKTRSASRGFLVLGGLGLFWLIAAVVFFSGRRKNEVVLTNSPNNPWAGR